MIITLMPISTIASWKVFPWTLYTEDDIKVESIPFQIYNGGKLGITKVYKKNTLLYSIDGYFSNFIILNSTGEFFVSIDFSLYRIGHDEIIMDKNNNRIQRAEQFKGIAVSIYKNGKILKTIDFTDLHIDTAQVIKKYDKFYWQTRTEHLFNCPAYIKNDTLSIFTIDNQIIQISLTTVEILKPKKLIAKKVDYFAKLLPKREFNLIQAKFPENFILPKLMNGKTIEEGLAKHLKLKTVESKKNALLDIYIHSLLINSEGKCEDCSVSPSKRIDINKEFGYNYNQDLSKTIEDWIYKQKYDTKLIPEYTDKYVFSAFIYMK